MPLAFRAACSCRSGSSKVESGCQRTCPTRRSCCKTEPALTSGSSPCVCRERAGTLAHMGLLPGSLITLNFNWAFHCLMLWLYQLIPKRAFVALLICAFQLFHIFLGPHLSEMMAVNGENPGKDLNVFHFMI